MGSSTNHPGLYKRGRYWWITRDPVEGRAISTRCSSLKAAKDFQAERERLGANPAYAASQAARLGEWCERYLDMRERAGTREVTLKYMSEKLGHWVRLHGHDAPLSTFSEVSVWDDYYRTRAGERASNHTVAKETRVFRQVLTSAKRSGSFAGDLTVLRPEGLTTSYTPRVRALTIAEVKVLLPALPQRERVLVAIAIATGARLGEACELAPGDVDLLGGLVTIRGTKTKGSHRVIPILSIFRPLLTGALEFLPIGPVKNNLRRNILAACARAEIAPATMNDFRRTHASILAELGAGEEHTAKLLGHSNTEMVKRVYAKPRATAIGELMERSIGVVTLGLDGDGMRTATARKCTKVHDSTQQSEAKTGFLSRRSEVQILPGAPNSARKLDATRELSQACSDLALPAAVLAYAYAAAGRSVEPSRDSLLRAAVRMGVAA